MKRKGSSITLDDGDDVSESVKKAKIESDSPIMPSPRRRAFSRMCKFEKGERIIGFYGGWPYIGCVSAIANVKMSFGSTYMLLVRWNGFSGKKASTWISEFDVVKHDEAGLKIKADMESEQRRLLAESGKPDKVKQKKIFLRVVEQFRGKKLAPFPSRFAPYAEEWQQIIRLTAIPKTLIDHLVHSEGLITEKKLILVDSEATSVHSTLSAWGLDDVEKQAYSNLIMELFDKYLFKVLLYRFEIPSATKRIVDQHIQGVTEMSRMFPMEYGLRLITFLPDLVTAASESLLVKGAESETITSLVALVNHHQSFLSYLEAHIDPILRGPVRIATLDEQLPESFGMDLITRASGDGDMLCERNTMDAQPPRERIKIRRHKRKCTAPIEKRPVEQGNAVSG